MSGDDNDRVLPVARALGAVPSGLFILTAGPRASGSAALVSFVQQVGFEPPCVTVAVGKGSGIEALIRDGGRFCLSVLDTGSKDLLGHFARGFAPGQPAFDGVDTAIDDAGIPYLTGALAWMSCEVVGEADWSDHVVFCGKVVGGERRSDDRPMVHLRRNGLSY